MKLYLLSFIPFSWDKCTFNKFSGLISLLLCGLFFQPLYSQSTAGLTQQPDTSYSTQGAYRKDVKYFPGIKVVNEFHFGNVGESKGMIFCRVNGHGLVMDAFYPRVKKARPQTAVIIIHGGGWRSGSRTQHYPLAQKLASLGYVCFTPEYRLSTEALFPAAVYDVKAAIRWVRDKTALYNIDTVRIAVLGFSAGGELAAFMGTTGNIPLFEGTGCNEKHSSQVNAVVDIDGTLSFVHPETGEGDDSKSTSAGTYFFGYAKAEKPEIWRIASPLTHADKQTAPTLFLNSSVARMHAGRNDFIALMDKYGIYTEVHEFENSPHSFCLYEPWFDPMVKYIDEFLKKVFP